MKYEVVTTEGNEFSEWVMPRDRTDYKMACCDCGLVHDLQFAVMRVAERLPRNRLHLTTIRKQEKFQVMFRARRNNRSTGQKRRFQNKDAR
jgi:hypothetical protein